MPTTQYIGARYVPIFADPVEWSNTKKYEPLTIVTHQGNSYTSRQFVPVGIDISNERFWALTGNYNAQVEQYRLETAQAVENAREYTDAAVENAREYTDTAVEQVDEWLTDAQNKYGAKPFAFDTVADMQAARDLLYVGAICHTNGFHASDDGGAAWYVISGTGEANGMDVIACGATLRANLILTTNKMNPEMLGAYGDGLHNDTDTIQKCIELASNIILSKQYMVAVRTTGEKLWSVIDIPSNRNIEINGSIILNANDKNGYHILNIENVSNVKIHGIGSIIGDKSTHTGTSGEWGHCIKIGASSNIEISGITIKDAWGDGIDIDSTIDDVEIGQSKNIYIHNCNIINNSRNNISVVSVENATFSNLYIAGANRTNPKSGIDIEPNPNTVTEVVNNLIISNCIFERNTTADILVALVSGNNLPSNITIDNCICTNQIAATVHDSNAHIKINNITMTQITNTCVTVSCVENSYIEFTNIFAYMTAQNRPLIIFGENANNISIDVDVYEHVPYRFIVNGVPNVNGGNTNTIKIKLHAQQTLQEASSTAIMAQTPIYEMNVEFSDIYEANVINNIPSYGCDCKLTANQAYMSIYKHLARKGCVYKIENASANSTTLRGNLDNSIIGTIETSHIGIFKSFADGSIIKIDDYALV